MNRLIFANIIRSDRTFNYDREYFFFFSVLLRGLCVTIRALLYAAWISSMIIVSIFAKVGAMFSQSRIATVVLMFMSIASVSREDSALLIKFSRSFLLEQVLATT